jgi:methyltransferase
MSPIALRIALAVFLAVIVAQRLGELWRSARNRRRLEARGAQEHGAGHFPLLVLVHVLYPLLLAAEVLWLGTRPSPTWPLWLGLWLGAQGLRYAAIHALGDHWNVRILVVPGARLVERGPYRWLRHPNYVAVVVELLSGSLLFGAWRTALVISALNAIALSIRIRAENRALARASAFARPGSSMSRRLPRLSSSSRGG